MLPEAASDVQTRRGEEHLGATVDLRYVARAGLLPELSRQTYDSVWKALREAVLNAVDADATEIELDFSRLAERGELSVIDDGTGMSTRDFCEHFMSIGGSTKFGSDRQYGRIGIGSLALLQYGESAVIETKPAGSITYTRAEIQHAWDLGRHERTGHLDDLPAGFASELPYDGSPDDHFTRVIVRGANEELLRVGSDPTTYFALLERLRRVLPLPWADGPLMHALRGRSPELVKALQDHVDEWCAPITVHSPWERDVRLARRSFGDDVAGGEGWSGPPLPVLKTIRIPGSSPRRKVIVAGYLLNQRRASPAWSGLTARVQNVAVEEHTFFDVTADPGFRKYISGEIWLLGDVDRERLINIDRASFNRGCADYQAVQRYMSRVIVDFKNTSVQKPQRAKVAIRRRIEARISALEAIGQVVQRAADFVPATGGLPVSEPTRRMPKQATNIAEDLREIGAEVVIRAHDPAAKHLYDLEVADDGERVRVELDASIVDPVVTAGGYDYRVQFARAGTEAPAIVIRNRPRRIVINLDHPSHRGSRSEGKIQMGLALEMAYLMGGANDGAAVYERMLDFLAAL